MLAIRPVFSRGKMVVVTHWSPSCLQLLSITQCIIGYIGLKCLQNFDQFLQIDQRTINIRYKTTNSAQSERTVKRVEYMLKKSYAL